MIPDIDWLISQKSKRLLANLEHSLVELKFMGSIKTPNIPFPNWTRSA